MNHHQNYTAIYALLLASTFTIVFLFLLKNRWKFATSYKNNKIREGYFKLKSNYVDGVIHEIVPHF